MNKNSPPDLTAAWPDLCESFKVTAAADGLPLAKLQGVTTNLQTATADDVVCYFLREQTGELLAKSWQVLQERLALGHYGLLVLNAWPFKAALPARAVIFPASTHQAFLAVQKAFADIFYPLPGDQHFLGVTGTNGKTTTVHLAVLLAARLGQKALSVGTLGVRDAEKVLAVPGGTSPSYIEYRKIFYQFAEVKYFFLEISSHALDQQRLYDLKLDHAAWPSFSQDHLDYHQTMEAYFAAKLKIINLLLPGGKLLLPHSQNALKHKILEHLSFAPVQEAEFWPRIEDLPLALQRGYNADNLALAYSWIKLLFKKQWAALDAKALKEMASSLNPPPGRCQWISQGRLHVIIDYAHTPDALENIISFLRRDFPEYKLAVIFGAGGNRDRQKRPLMGAVAAAGADQVMITSDNPRDEDPAEIITEIKAGITPTLQHLVQTQADRRQAINEVLTQIKGKQENWLILLAGKGHEAEQEIKGHKYHFSDEEVVRDWFKQN